MEYPIQPETALSYARRLQVVTIQLCMAWMDTNCVPEVGWSESSRMKQYVSRVCGLTEKDFERVKDGTEKTKEEKVNINDGINVILGGGKYALKKEHGPSCECNACDREYGPR